jgi:hypothetical protein
MAAVNGRKPISVLSNGAGHGARGPWLLGTAQDDCAPRKVKAWRPCARRQSKKARR